MIGWNTKLALLTLVAVISRSLADHPPSAPLGDNEVIEEEPNGVIDFSQAVPQKDGSLCITKTKYIEKMEKQPVKECWTQNVTQCHDTYVTEFKPNQEQECEENFWKACKITFKEVGYNYTLQTCMKPLVKKCDEPQSQSGYGAPKAEPKVVCQTWFESVCNTTFAPSIGAAPGDEQKPNTWCEKVPKKICAPDFCEMVPGEEQCVDKTIQSTVVRPEEICDLQPSKQCRLVTNLVPHLEAKTVCKEIPKEVCHLKLDNPHFVKKPITMRWCTKPKANIPSYLPPPSYTAAAAAPVSQYGPPSTSTYSPPPPPPPPPAYSAPAAPSYGAPSSAPTASPVYYKPVSSSSRY